MADQTTTDIPAADLPQATFEAPDPARRPARLALYLGVTLVILGAVALYLGYNGAANNALVQAQTPYLISGGLLGVGLMALGGITTGLYVLLVVQADFRKELNAMREAMENLSESISRQAFAPATNGTATKATSGVVMVARGSSSYHRPDCRLVERSEHARPMPRDEADREGLLPCRICKP